MTTGRRKVWRTPLIWVPVFFCVFYIAYFSPALIQGKLLAPGDGYNFYYSAFEMPWRLWEPGILSGYPVFADPQFFLWYPLKWLMPTYDAFIIVAYVIASSAMFGFVFSKTRSTTGSLAAAIIFGAGSFTTGHLGHASILHAAVWMPLVAWSIDRYAETRSKNWFVAGAISISLCVLSGHPQIALYVLMLAGAMALRNILFAFPGNAKSALNLTVAYSAMVVLGLALCSVQLVPFIQLGQASSRAAGWSFSDFASYSLPLRQLPSILVPYLYGGRPSSPSGDFGDWSLTETLCFAGIGTLLLVSVALQSRQKRDGSLFWLSIIVLALLLCTVGQNGIGRLIYEVPVLGSFRAQARAGILFIFAVAVLAGFGIARLQERSASNAKIFAAAIAVTVLTIVAVWSSLRSNWWNQAMHRANLDAWAAAPDIVAALLFIFLTTVMLVLVRKYERSRYLGLALLCLLTADVSRFGWFYEWSFGPKKSAELSQFWHDIRTDTIASGGRLLVLSGESAKHNPIAPNANLHFDLYSANGYGPLEPSEYRNATGIDTGGVLATAPSKALRTILAVSQIVYPFPLQMQFGRCGTSSPGRTLSTQMPRDVVASEIQIVSRLACAVSRPDGDLAFIVDVDADDHAISLPLLVGRDTSEWAHDRPDVAAKVKHAKAKVFRTFDKQGTPLNSYVANIEFAKNDLPIDRLSISLPDGVPGISTVESIVFLNSEKKEVFSVPMLDLIVGEKIIVNPANDGFAVSPATGTFHGLYWLVKDWVPMPTATAEAVVQSGKMPDGADFDPTSMAITEDTLPLPSSMEGSGADTVKLVSRETGKLTFDVESKREALLFVSQSFHDGWNAKVNGIDARIHRTNAAFQSVAVPAGKSVVELSFWPRSLMLGIFMSLASALALVVILSAPTLRRLFAGSDRRPGLSTANR